MNWTLSITTLREVTCMRPSPPSVLYFLMPIMRKKQPLPNKRYWCLFNYKQQGEGERQRKSFSFASVRISFFCWGFLLPTTSYKYLLATHTYCLNSQHIIRESTEKEKKLCFFSSSNGYNVLLIIKKVLLYVVDYYNSHCWNRMILKHIEFTHLF